MSLSERDGDEKVAPNLDRNVTVPLWAAVYAVKWGLHANDHSSADMSALTWRIWDELPPSVRDQIRDEVNALPPDNQRGWSWLTRQGPPAW